MLLLDRHGGHGRLAMTLRTYPAGFRIMANPSHGHEAKARLEGTIVSKKSMRR